MCALVITSLVSEWLEVIGGVLVYGHVNWLGNWVKSLKKKKHQLGWVSLNVDCVSCLYMKCPTQWHSGQEMQPTLEAALALGHSYSGVVTICPSVMICHNIQHTESHRMTTLYSYVC